jgi:hypothetical protein
MSAEGIGGGHIALVREILESLKYRKERKAASEAGRLTFWDDGMLRELRSIAAGEVDPVTISQLREKFETSEGRVNQALDGLLRIRNKLGPSRIGRQIDAVVHSTNFGKEEVRENIRELLRTRKRHELRRKAEQVCRKIEILNADGALESDGL